MTRATVVHREQFAGREPDRVSTGFGGMRVEIFSAAGEPKPRELCAGFSFELHAPRDEKDVKAQEKFAKGYARLTKPKPARRRAA